jgi:hypothetical protein
MSFSFIPHLTESETYVKGRSQRTARALVESTGKRGAELRTTSHGYVLPTELLPEDTSDLELYTAKDRPAVPTEPNTSTNVDEVHNVGQAPAAVTASDPAAGEDSAEEKAEQFDPSKATIAEIEDYLDGSDEAERARVFAAEAAGKNRKGVLDLAETSEGDK